MQNYRVYQLATVGEAQIVELAGLLIDCVDGGASVSFMHPLDMDKAQAFWRGVAQGVARGERALMVAEDDAGIIGTVQLVLAQPDNQPHRADLAKMLVRRRARKRGVGEALLRQAEQVARDRGKWLLVLDTASPEAERLYERQGWQRAGVVPDYALMPDGALCDTAFYYRKLAPQVLDNPVWNALAGAESGSGSTGSSGSTCSTGETHPHQSMAVRNGLAARYPRDVSPLAGLREPSPQAFGDLRPLVEIGEEVWLLTPAPLTLPPEWELVRARYIDQMVYTAAQPAQPISHAWPLLQLETGDVPEMMALAAETKPGPFVQKTIAMGRYLGVREAGGTLAAMSGTRMALAGYTEISAVCTSPEARGKGHARALMLALMAQVQASGRTPFLHVKTENGAKQVYEKLGFAVRREICFSVIRRAA